MLELSPDASPQTESVENGRTAAAGNGAVRQNEIGIACRLAALADQPTECNPVPPSPHAASSIIPSYPPPRLSEKCGIGQHHRMTRIAALFLSGLLLTGRAHAQSSPRDKHGIDVYADRVGGRNTTIHVVIDKNDLLDSFSFWKDGRGLRSEATETDFRSHPYTYAAAFALAGVAPALHGPTSMLQGAAASVSGEIIEPDAYGHPQRHKMFSFTFTKALADRIDWDGFEPEGLQTITRDFRFTPWFEQNYRRQPK